MHPDMATELGDHRFDDRLPDARPEALEEERRTIEGRLRELEALDLEALLPEHRVDAEVLGAALRRRRYELEVLREHDWNPLVGNPAGAVYTLLARDFARWSAAWPLCRSRWRWRGARSTTCPACTWRPRSASSPAPPR